MTLSPTDSRNVVGLAGDAYPNFRVGPVCCAPDCSRFAEHAHHLWRRSQLGGPFDWVRLEDGTILGNKVPLCFDCHRRVTDNEVRIVWLHDKFWWCDHGVLLIGDQAISPQPPIHGKPTSVTRHSAPDGPASNPTCSECGRSMPHKHEGPKEPKRRRKTWSITVPDDAEDGALVLDTLIEECRKLFGHGEEKNLRYITTVQALALVVQNGHVLVGD